MVKARARAFQHVSVAVLSLGQWQGGLFMSQVWHWSHWAKAAFLSEGSREDTYFWLRDAASMLCRFVSMSFLHLQTQRGCLSAHPSLLTSPSSLALLLPACPNPVYSSYLQISQWAVLTPSVAFLGFEYEMSPTGLVVNLYVNSCQYERWWRLLELRPTGRSSSLGDDLWKLCLVLGLYLLCFLAMWCELLFSSMPSPWWTEVSENMDTIILSS